MVFHVSRLVFMVPGQLSWFFMVLWLVFHVFPKETKNDVTKNEEGLKMHDKGKK